MEPLLSNVSTSTLRNEPQDLLSRLYREIGIPAVAAAFTISESALKSEPTAREKRESLKAA